MKHIQKMFKFLSLLLIVFLASCNQPERDDCHSAKLDSLIQKNQLLEEEVQKLRQIQAVEQQKAQQMYDKMADTLKQIQNRP